MIFYRDQSIAELKKAIIKSKRVNLEVEKKKKIGTAVTHHFCFIAGAVKSPDNETRKTLSNGLIMINWDHCNQT